MIIKKGAIIALTSGEYSDYCLDGHVIALKDFDPQDLARDFFSGNVVERHHGKEAFMAYLIINGFVDPTNTVAELWLGNSYDDFHPDNITVREESSIEDDPPYYSPSLQHVT